MNGIDSSSGRMKRFFVSAWRALGLAPQASAAAMAPERFTEEFAAALRGTLPDHSVLVVESLHLKLVAPDGGESTAFVDNAYAEYLQDHSAASELMTRYAASFVEVAVGEERFDPRNIVPVVKDRAWLDEIGQIGERIGSGPLAERVVEELNQDLLVVYAEDTPMTIRYVTPRQLEEAGVQRETLRALALANLRRILPPVQTHRGPLVSMLTAGADYVASLLLIEEIWDARKLGVEGEIVVALPSRDVVLFTGSRNAQGVEKLGEMARRAVAGNAHSLTSRLFVYRCGRFERFEERR